LLKTTLAENAIALFETTLAQNKFNLKQLYVITAQTSLARTNGLGSNAA
jgi:hypothetical protein